MSDDNSKPGAGWVEKEKVEYQPYGEHHYRKDGFILTKFGEPGAAEWALKTDKGEYVTDGDLEYCLEASIDS